MNYKLLNTSTSTYANTIEKVDNINIIYSKNLLNDSLHFKITDMNTGYYEYLTMGKFNSFFILYKNDKSYILSNYKQNIELYINKN